MLELSHDQWSRLDALEKQQYVDEVRKAVVAGDARIAQDSGLLARLQAAYRRALELGFVDGPGITQFLVHEAYAPGFDQQPAVRAWLAKPGDSVEQRFADLVATLKARTREG
jgi:hypothetical protein